MQLKTYSVGPFAENTYLLIESGKAVLFDPGFYEEQEFNTFQSDLDQASAELLAVVLTHAHVDHILGLNRVLNAFDIPVYLSDEDRYLWNNYTSQARMFGFNVAPIDTELQPIPITENWEIAPFTFDVRYTPGHAPDHLVFYIEEESFVIAGDTLFKQGIGRTDLYKGNFSTLEKSIREELYTLPSETIIYPGHGPKTTVVYEKNNNPFI